MKRITLIAFLLVLLAVPATAQDVTRHAVLIGGLGGSAEYTESFRQYLFETRRAFVEDFGFPEANVTVLAENALADAPFVNAVSTAENIRAHFEAMAGAMAEGAHLYVVLFGHGSFDGERAQLNIPRRDLDDTDYAALLGALPAGRIVFVNTASASAPFIEAISAEDRVVITATRTGTQRNETTFPRFFVEALTTPAADLDKNGDLSVREVFHYTAEKTARAFEESNHLATENALLDDDGDALGHRLEELDAAAEGNLAGLTYLRRRTAALAALPESSRHAVSELLRTRDALERDIAALKSRKSSLSENRYYAELEALFVRLARLNDRIEGM